MIRTNKLLYIQFINYNNQLSNFYHINEKRVQKDRKIGIFSWPGKGSKLTLKSDPIWLKKRLSRVKKYGTVFFFRQMGLLFIRQLLTSCLAMKNLSIFLPSIHVCNKKIGVSVVYLCLLVFMIVALLVIIADDFG
jgi:hypothetical protein